MLLISSQEFTIGTIADNHYFNYESDLSNMTTNHYWPQAHAMDVIVDAYKRTSQKQYLDFYPLWWKGAPEYNFSGKEIDPWWNEFVDDMEWIALAQLRMYETTQREEYFLKAKQMYNDWIWSTWGPEEERSEEHTSELQSRPHLVCRLLLEKKKK